MQGIFTALITPFIKTGKIDYVVLKQLLIQQSNSSIDGVVLMGSTGEEKLLSSKEKLNIAKTALKILKNKQIYIGINQNTIKNAKNELQKYNNLAISGFLISPPPYLKLSTAEVVNFYSQLAKTTNKDICLYNVPSRTGTLITPGSVKELSKISNITSIKDATGNLSQTKELRALLPDLNILCGNDNLYQKMMLLGANGAVSVITNILPNIFSQIISKNGTKLWQQCLPLVSFIAQNQNPSAIKALMSSAQKIDYILREPLLPNINYSAQADALLPLLQNLCKY